MKVFRKTSKLLAVLLIVLAQFIFVSVRKVQAAAVVDLGTAESFAILAGDQVTDTNISVIVGDVGLSPATWALSPALTCAEVTGTIYSVDGTGPLPCRVTNAGLLTTAQNDLTTAFTDAGGRTPATVMAGSDNQLGGQTLTPGVYSFSAASTANIIGTLTLDTQGDPNAVFIFQAESTLVTDSASSVEFINGSTCNVFWHVPTSATLGTGTDFKGTIMADQSITDTGGSTVIGRFLARIADVVINDTSITVPVCAAATSAPVSLSSSGFVADYCEPFESVAPIIIGSRRIDADSVFISWAPYSGLDTFIVEYGTENGSWLYNTRVTGFSTTLNDLPRNTPIWVRVTASDYCSMGVLGEPKLVGGPGLPNTGLAASKNNVPWFIMTGAFVILSAFLLRRTRV